MATFVAACSQGQHMHSAQTRNKKNPKGGLLDKDWVTRHSGNIGHSIARHSFYLLLVRTTDGLIYAPRYQARVSRSEGEEQQIIVSNNSNDKDSL